MKVLLLNGSPRVGGNTAAALAEMESVFAQEGIETETVQIGTWPIRGCTACRYCVSHCPKQLNIPKLLELYNEQSFSGGGIIAPRAMMALPEQQRATACIGCRSCEAFCPQNIKISEAMTGLAQWAEEFFKRKT